MCSWVAPRATPATPGAFPASLSTMALTAKRLPVRRVMSAASADRLNVVNLSRWIAASSAAWLNFQQCASDTRPNECRLGPRALIALPSMLRALRFGRHFGRLFGFAAVNARSPRVGLLLHQAASSSDTSQVRRPPSHSLRRDNRRPTRRALICSYFGNRPARCSRQIVASERFEARSTSSFGTIGSMVKAAS
jgi:hypothetical protein